MKIIGIAGMAKAGKTTAAKRMAEWLFRNGYTPVLDQFAKPLKEASHSVGFVKGSQYDSQYREFCQRVGAQARALSEDWWVDLMDNRLLCYYDTEQCRAGTESPLHETVVIIDDVRYQNEVELITFWGGRTVFISAADRIEDGDAAWREHESERLATLYEQGDLCDELFDISISNNAASLDQFKDACDLVAEQLVSAREEIR